MFEQSTLQSGPASKRLWTTCVGITGEALLVAGAIVAPMVWPQVLPRTTMITSLLPPVPRPIAKAAAVEPRRPQVAIFRKPYLDPGVIYQPVKVPTQVAMNIEPPPEIQSEYGVVGGFESRTPGGDQDGVIGGILRNAAALPPPRTVEKSHPPVTAAPGEPKRVPQGGRVKPAQVIHRVEPQYPELAKHMRVEGVVELMGVISTSGRLIELRLVSGHPLLAKAALDAVSQWIYAPTQLNGEPVEVIAPITVTFKFH